jgi:CDGSH-type Zn-finger protein/uncharacterized Fe-S cluster protein YjdI
MSDSKIFKYEGKSGAVAWNGDLCIHVGECGRAEGELFVAGRKPWCQPDTTGDEGELVQILQRCPTGALSYEKEGAVVDESPVSVNTIVVANNGPLYASGDLDIAAATESTPGIRYRAALCRCGESKNKPFCDNSHEAVNFVDRGAVGSTGTALESTGGALTVKAAPNGPLLISGNLQIVAGSGRIAWSGTKTALCRCGQSKNKPFCDGAHKAAGFVAD